MKKIFLILLIALCACSKTDDVTPGGDDGKDDHHPSMLLTADNLKAVKDAVGRNEALAGVNRRILELCKSYMTQNPVTYTKQGIRLSTASTASARIMNLAYAYRMTGERAYAQRAEREMLAVCDFQDWNPSHFLDAATLALGMGLGYDWLYDVLSAKTRDRVSSAIYTKAILPSRDKSYNSFYNRTNNWNSVCNAGLVIGALAISDIYPAASRAIVEKCRETNPAALKCYGPDGGYPEGPSYWGYGTTYQVMMFDAMQSVLGSDYGLSATPGFMESARFAQYMNAPTGDCFNFSDAPARLGNEMIMYWFAAKTGDASLLYLENRRLTANPAGYCGAQWMAPFMVFASQADVASLKAPKSGYWSNDGEMPVFVYRGGWDSADDVYVGVKGGSATTPHAHMDAGSFVYERDGVRWAMDLGMQEYYSLESAGVSLWDYKQAGERWTIYRYCNKAHNTLTINGNRHVAAANAKITATYTDADCKGADVDLTSTLANELQSAVRTVAVDGNDNLEVTDRLAARADRDAEVMWVMVTAADARITDNRSIELSQNGKRMLLSVDCGGLTPVMQVQDNTPPNSYDAPNPGTCRVGFTVKVGAGESAVLKVRLSRAG